MDFSRRRKRMLATCTVAIYAWVLARFAQQDAALHGGNAWAALVDPSTFALPLVAMVVLVPVTVTAVAFAWWSLVTLARLIIQLDRWLDAPQITPGTPASPTGPGSGSPPEPTALF